ncbi:hypothetical protein LINPERPRIM_LOCUS38475, partial [Linum perenne]
MRKSKATIMQLVLTLAFRRDLQTRTTKKIICKAVTS